MRNSLKINVSKKTNGSIVVHFCNAVEDNRADHIKIATIEVRKGQMQNVTAPTKLQGSDFNLVFPLSKTTNVGEVDFNEIEEIMVANGVAHNVTSINKENDNNHNADYTVVYNERNAV